MVIKKINLNNLISKIKEEKKLIEALKVEIERIESLLNDEKAFFNTLMKIKNMASKSYDPKLRIISEEMPNEKGKSIWSRKIWICKLKMIELS